MNYLRSLAVAILVICVLAIITLTLPYSLLLGVGAAIWGAVHQFMYGDVEDDGLPPEMA